MSDAKQKILLFLAKHGWFNSGNIHKNQADNLRPRLKSTLFLFLYFQSTEHFSFVRSGPRLFSVRRESLSKHAQEWERGRLHPGEVVNLSQGSQTKHGRANEHLSACRESSDDAGRRCEKVRPKTHRNPARNPTRRNASQSSYITTCAAQKNWSSVSASQKNGSATLLASRRGIVMLSSALALVRPRVCVCMYVWL